MLKPDFAYCHTVTLEQWTGRKVSRETYGPPRDIRGRVNLTNKRVFLNNGGAGQEIIAAGTVFLPAGTEVAPEDKLTFRGKAYKVVSVQPGLWFDGRETHVEAVFQ